VDCARHSDEKLAEMILHALPDRDARQHSVMEEMEALGLLETVEIDPVTGSKRPPGQPSAMLLGLAIRLQRLLDEWAEDGPDPLGRDELLNALGCPYSVVPEQCRFLRCIYRHFGKNPLLEGVSWTRPDVGF